MWPAKLSTLKFLPYLVLIADILSMVYFVLALYRYKKLRAHFRVRDNDHF